MQHFGILVIIGLLCGDFKSCFVHVVFQAELPEFGRAATEYSTRAVSFGKCKIGAILRDLTKYSKSFKIIVDKQIKTLLYGCYPYSL
jgi:hypothetical protein